MSVTTQKTNIMTVIKENGGDPTGSGGNLINENFKTIDGLFTGQYAKRALQANQVLSAPGIAQNTGFSPPTSWPTVTLTSTYPIALWGDLGNAHTSGSMIEPPMCAALPPYGPIMFHVLVAGYNTADTSSRIYAECLVFGWDTVLTGAKVLHAYDESGNTLSLNAIASKYGLPTSPTKSVAFYTLNGALYCGLSSSSNSVWCTHMTAIGIYPQLSPIYSGSVSGS